MRSCCAPPQCLYPQSTPDSRLPSPLRPVRPGLAEAGQPGLGRRQPGFRGTIPSPHVLGSTSPSLALHCDLWDICGMTTPPELLPRDSATAWVVGHGNPNFDVSIPDIGSLIIYSLTFSY